MGKEQALWDWVQTCPLLSAPILFDFLREHEGSAGIIPVSDSVKRTYIDGTQIREYAFALQFTYRVSDSTDDVNINNLQSLGLWQDWIDSQQVAGIFPDFGEKCGAYRFMPPESAPVMALLFPDGIGKYQLFTRLQYMQVI